MVKKILIVDDSHSINLTVKTGLEDLDSNCEIVCVESGEQCIDLLKKNQIPDAILLDLMMPGMSGWEVFDRIKENVNWENIPIVFLTARTDSVAVTAGRFLGEDYIEKPFEISDLKKRLDIAIRKKRQN